MLKFKYYLHFEVSGYPEKTSKLQVPNSWLDKPVRSVMELFTKAYNTNNPDLCALELDQMHLETADGDKIYSNAVVKEVLQDRADYYLKFGAHIQEIAVDNTADNTNKLRCRNYGCNQYFTEEENEEGSCSHHTGPPIFHVSRLISCPSLCHKYKHRDNDCTVSAPIVCHYQDTMKAWSCCKDQHKAFDFESFQLIKGCATGRHSVVPQKIAISASPNNPAMGHTDSLPIPPTVVRSIADFNTTNPNAASATTAALNIVNADRKSSRNSDGVTAKCQRKGCQKVFSIADNSHEACSYHAGAPVFHDAVKLWSCCSDKKCYDFEEFLAVPGCQTGFHDDGVIDLSSS